MERRSITELKNRHAGQDIWVVAAGPSMEYVDPEFFRNKLVLGVNEVYRHFPCTYLVRKDAPFSEAAALCGVPLIIAEHDGGEHSKPKNEVPVDAWFFDHPDLDEGRILSPDDHSALDVIGTDRLIVSHSTITTGIHMAAYLGAANIIICGHDGGELDGKVRYPGYEEFASDADDRFYRDWVRIIMAQTRLVRDRVQQVYGCRIYSLNPFLGFNLDGHKFSGLEKLDLAFVDQREALDQLRAELCAIPEQCRDAAKIEAEYGVGKYGAVLAQNPATVVEAWERLLLLSESDLDRERLISISGRLYSATVRNATRRRFDRLDRTLHRVAIESGATSFCELGCGLGQNIARLPNACGGELTENGRRLAERFGLNVHPFDFREPASYGFIPERSVVFTCAAVEQLPQAACVLAGLRKFQERIAAVVHFEPFVWADRDGGELGRLQNEYLRRCDYNRDLLNCLSGQNDVEMLNVEMDVLGVNPLNPQSLLVWRFHAA